VRKVPTPSGPFPFQLYFEDLGEIDEICLEALKRQSKKFRYLLNEDAMATEKTAEGIRKFAADIAKLEKFIASKIN
jgi:transaldolase